MQNFNIHRANFSERDPLLFGLLSEPVSEIRQIEGMHYAVLVLLIIIIIYLYRETYYTRVFYFYKPKCPACEDKRPIWETFSRESSIIATSINTELPANKEICDNFGVRTVPHLVKVKNNIRTVYEEYWNVAALKDWLK